MIVKVYEKVAKEVEVSFPLYRNIYIVASDPDAYGELTEFSLSINYDKSDMNLFIKRPYSFSTRDDSDYVLGEGEHACSPEEFKQALAQFKKMMKRSPWALR